jgi:TM2 domain-containing membrane protein YozV
VTEHLPPPPSTTPAPPQYGPPTTTALAPVALQYGPPPAAGHAAPAAHLVPSAKQPVISLVLSFVFCGLGQIYNGEVGKGVGFMVAWLVSVVLCFLLIGLFLLPVIFIWNLVDAYQGAERFNLRHGVVA